MESNNQEVTNSTLSLLQGLLLHGIKKAVRLGFARLGPSTPNEIFTRHEKTYLEHHIYVQI